MCSPPAMRSVISSRVFSPLRKSAALDAFDEDRKVVPDSQGVDDIVGDEDDRDALLPRLQDDAQNVRRFLDAKRGGRLVEDQHAGAKVDGAGDRKGLTLAAGQAADQAVAIIDARDAELTRLADSDLVGALAVEDSERPPALGRLGADEERASDAHERKRPAELVHRRDAMLAGVAGAVEGDGLAVHFQRAGRRLVDPGKDLDQRRLARAVVAEQAQEPRPRYTSREMS